VALVVVGLVLVWGEWEGVEGGWWSMRRGNLAGE